MQRPAAIDRLAAMVLEQESRAATVARLLHDRAGQSLSALGFLLSGAPAGPEVNESLDQAIDAIRAACNQLQSNIAQRAGIALALEMLTERFQKEFGLSVDLKLEGKQRLDPATAHAVYRIVELALENVHRHSGATSAEVTLNVSDGGTEGCIRDRGRGFQVRSVLARPTGTGIVLMETYAGNVNLQLRIASVRGRGTIVRFQTI